MNKLLLLAAVLCTLHTEAQNKKRFAYYLNNKLESVPKSKANIFGAGIMEDGVLKLTCYASKDKTLLFTAHFLDSSLAVMQGLFTTYHSNGDVAEEGYYEANNKEGVWQKWDTLGQLTDSVRYKADKVMQKVQWGYAKQGVLSYKVTTDSVAGTFQAIDYDGFANITRMVELKGQRGLLTTYGKEGVTTDSLFIGEKQSAEFPGSDNSWQRYLEKNLDANVPVRMNAPAGVYQVKVRFIVSTDGTLEDITPLTSHGYGMENEVIRILKNGPKWTPALRQGRNVRSYRIQPVTFVVQEEK